MLASFSGASYIISHSNPGHAFTLITSCLLLNSIHRCHRPTKRIFNSSAMYSSSPPLIPNAPNWLPPLFQRLYVPSPFRSAKKPGPCTGYFLDWKTRPLIHYPLQHHSDSDRLSFHTAGRWTSSHIIRSPPYFLRSHEDCS